MKILIIGSKGFIGSHCADFFKVNNDVWECDVIADYNKENYIWIDSVDSDFLEIFQNHRFDLCINCSGAANVPFSFTKSQLEFFKDPRINQDILQRALHERTGRPVLLNPVEF